MRKEKRSYGKYTNSFRIGVVREYLRGGISKNALCRKYSLPYVSTLNGWISTFVKEEESEKRMKKEEKLKELDEIERLKRELQEARLALLEEKMRSDAYNTLINVAEKMFNISI